MKTRNREVKLAWRGKREEPPAHLAARHSCVFVPSELYSPKELRGDEKPDSRVYLGDNLQVLASLYEEYREKVDFIYIDPPFCTGNRYPLRTVLEDTGSRQEVHTAPAYSDRWEGGIAEYLSFLAPRIALMRELLAPHGNFVVHLDWRAASHVRLLLDEIFGPERLINEIVWYKGFRGTRAKGVFQRAHDILWWYAKGEDHFWRQGYEPYKDRDLKRYNQTDEEGRRYALIKRRRADGTIYYGRTYPGADGKWRNDVIADIPTMAATSGERTGFATQKPEKLLRLLVESLSPPGGLVADFFSGTGTTLRAAAASGRRFLGAEISPPGLHFTRWSLLKGESPAEFTVWRAEKDRPAPVATNPPVERDSSGAVLLRAPPGDENLIEFWAVQPSPLRGVFRPAWYSCGNRRSPLADKSPPFGTAAELTVLLSFRDGREKWISLG